MQEASTCTVQRTHSSSQAHMTASCKLATSVGCLRKCTHEHTDNCGSIEQHSSSVTLQSTYARPCLQPANDSGSQSCKPVHSSLLLACASEDSAHAWLLLGSHNTGELNYACCMLQDRIYLAGGNGSDDVVHASMEMFVPAAGKWMTCAALSQPRSGMAMFPVYPE